MQSTEQLKGGLARQLSDGNLDGYCMGGGLSMAHNQPDKVRYND